MNPTEVFHATDFAFSGNADWDVGQGGVSAIILETGATTAQNRASITVRYPTRSPTAAEADTAFIQATKGGGTKTKKRTVFNAHFAPLNFSELLDLDNNRLFAPESGNRRMAGFNWAGENGATRTVAKMEAVLVFLPFGIDWAARGVTFVYSTQPGGKFHCRLQRKRILQVLWEEKFTDNRVIGEEDGTATNDTTWVYDGNSDELDAQYPTPVKPNQAFRLDAPGFDPIGWDQISLRADLKELAEWHNGDEWSQINDDSVNSRWFANESSVLPIGAKGGANNHGTGAAQFVFNVRPVANAGPDQTVAMGALVTLDGSDSGDADHDTLVYDWLQTAGTLVTLSDNTLPNPTFTMPNTPVTFSLYVTDITSQLYHHAPVNHTSFADSVTISLP